MLHHQFTLYQHSHSLFHSLNSLVPNIPPHLMDSMMKLPKDTASDEFRFECPKCGKIFSCGQGLGGHKRVHMEKRNNKRNYETMAAEADDQEMGDQKTPFPCPVCQQCFPSQKALHGHMRKHPNRGWRGMKPPTPEEVDDVPVIADLSNSQPPTVVQDSVPSQDSANNSLFVSNINSNKPYVCETCAIEGDEKLVDYMEQPEDGGAVEGEKKENAGKGSKLVFNIDLNELPPSDEDEDEDETS